MTEPTDQVVERLAERITNCVCTCHTDDRRYEGRCHACCGLSIDDIRAALREALRIGREQAQQRSIELADNHVQNTEGALRTACVLKAVDERFQKGLREGLVIAVEMAETHRTKVRNLSTEE